MKIIFKTKISHGNLDIVHRGVQLDCQVIDYGYDSPEEYKTINTLLDIIKADIKDSGVYLNFLPRRKIEASAVNEATSKTTSPEMIALKAMLNSAKQQARAYKKMYDDLKARFYTQS